MFSQPPHLAMRRAPFISSPSPACGGGLGRGHARLSAFHHGSYRQGFRPLGATPGQASWDVAGRSIRYGRPNRGAKISRSYAGVTRARLSQSRECTSSMMPEAARVRSVSVRARAPHSLRFREYPRPKASFTERDSLNPIPEMETNVNEKATGYDGSPATHIRPGFGSSLRGATATKQSSGAMNARFVDLHNETAALDCFAEPVIGPATSGNSASTRVNARPPVGSQ